MRDGAPIHGHTGLEILWTAIPVVIVTIFGTWAGIVLSDNESVAKAGTEDAGRARDRLALLVELQVRHRRRLRVVDPLPAVNEGVKLETTSTDVIHGFFVAEWRVKADAVPGIINRTFATPDRLGTFRVLCSALCGPGHAGMSTQNVTKVVSSADFAKWVGEPEEGLGDRIAPGRRSSPAASAAAAATRLARPRPRDGRTESRQHRRGREGRRPEPPSSYARASSTPNKVIAKGYPAQRDAGELRLDPQQATTRRPGRIHLRRDQVSAVSAPVQHEPATHRPPAGPKRSVWIRPGWWRHCCGRGPQPVSASRSPP